MSPLIPSISDNTLPQSAVVLIFALLCISGQVVSDMWEDEYQNSGPLSPPFSATEFNNRSPVVHSLRAILLCCTSRCRFSCVRPDARPPCLKRKRKIGYFMNLIGEKYGVSDRLWAKILVFTRENAEARRGVCVCVCVTSEASLSVSHTTIFSWS